MSNMIAAEALDRRSAIRRIALGLTAAGVLDLEAAQHVHEAAAGEKAKGPYKVKAFQAAEYRTLQRLAELIVPADEVSGSALEAGAPEFIDLLCSQNEKLADIFHGGLAWLEAEMTKRYGKGFVAAGAADQAKMLDLLVAADKTERERQSEELVYRRSADYQVFSGYTTRRPGEFGPGVKFFEWVRKMTMDAFYTSAMGIKDVGYIGNGAYSKYEVPKEAMEYAMKRSPFAAG